MDDLLEFYEQLQNDVIIEAQPTEGKNGDSRGGDFRERAFTRIAIEELAASGILESPLECHYETTLGASGIKVNAYSIPDEDTRIFLIVTDYYPTPEPTRLTSADIDRSMNLALRFFKASINGLHESIESGSDAYAMIKDIYIHKDDIERVHILLITNGLTVQKKEKLRKETLAKYRVSYEVWDIERLRRFRSGRKSYEAIEVDLSETNGIPCISISDDKLGYSTCLSVLPGFLLYNWYDEYGAKLLELNVRAYLQARGKINKGILETLLKEPHHFLAYNNGITIVAEEIILNTTGDRITAIKGLQIVNGGQTTASIHRAKKDNQADLSHVYVQAKLTVVPPAEFEEMVPEISRFSNTQNKVSEVDLRANHPFHVGIERVSRKTWAPGEQSMWFYERARGSYQTERTKTSTTPAQKARFDRTFPSAQRFNKEDLARYSNIWNGLPHIVSRGGQKSFLKFMESVPNYAKDWQPPAEEFKTLIAKAILFRRTQDLAKELEIPAFRINVVNYTVALLAEQTAKRIDLISIWNKQDISDALKSQIKEWLPKVANALISSSGERNPTEWFKMEQCWKQLRDVSTSWQLNSSVSEELKKTALIPYTVDETVYNNIARCMGIDATTWFKIQIWGSESGNLKDWQVGIANTLAGYSAQGWKRKPSEKQAKHGIEIYTTYINSTEV
ncbi:MAG: AIPR family protein [Nitrospiria bacterium]